MNLADAILPWALLGPALLGFMLPGWQIARRLDLPAPVLSAFLLSAAGWFALVLGCQCAGLPLTRTLLVGGWLTACLACSLWLRRLPPVLHPAKRVPCAPIRADLPWLVPIGIALISVIVRAVVDPLNGWDTSFRWDYLARAILDFGHFNFYPPVTAADYEIYAWPDGIPPLASFLNLWIYLACGASEPALLAGRLVGEVLLIGAGVFSLARQLHGPRAGWPALAALSGCSLFLWSATTGQETGLTSLSIVAMVYFIGEYNRAPGFRPALCAGLAASVAAISRDYTLAFAVLGAALVAARPADRARGLLAYALPLLLTAGPWYARNWALTGNPLFPNATGALFPGHPVLVELLANVRDYWSFSTRASSLSSLASTVLVLCLSLSLGLAGLGRRPDRPFPALLALAAMISLWAWSAQLTAGGWNYSLRVLAPAAALLACFAGWPGSLGNARVRRVILVAATLFAIDAGRRAWLLPSVPNASPTPYNLADWHRFRVFADNQDNDPRWAIISRIANGETTLVDQTVAHTLIGRVGGRAAMIFSPAAAPCFTAEQEFTRTCAALRANRIRFVLLTVEDPISAGIIAAHPFLRQLTATPSLPFCSRMRLYDLASLASEPPP